MKDASIAVSSVGPLGRAKGARGMPLAWHLGALCFALVVPILLLAAMLAWSYTEAERARIERGALRTAHEFTAAIDREFAGLTATIKVLALSHLLQQEDLDGFDAQARDVYQQIGINVVLRDRQSRQLVNTRVPRGTPLPTNMEAESDQIVLKTKKPTISNLFIGSVSRQPLFIVNAPVVRGGDVIYFLNLSVEPQQLHEILFKYAFLPASWAVLVADRHGFMVTHSSRHQTVLNQQLPKLIWGGRTNPDDVIREDDPAGGHQPVLIAFSRSQLTGWIVAVTVPTDQVAAPLHRSLIGVMGLGVTILTLSLGLALAFSRRVGRPVAALAVQAAQLGKGHVARPLSTPVREINTVSNILSEAYQERNSAEAALRSSEERYRTLSSATREGVAFCDKWRVVEANRTFWTMFGFHSRDEIVGRTALRMLAANALKATLAEARRGPVARYESIGHRPDGTSFPMEMYCGPIVYQGRRMRVVIVRDLTDQKTAEISLRDSEARLKLAQAAGRIGTWDWDVASARLLCSSSYCRLYGLDSEGPGHETPQDWLAQVHPDDRERVVSEWQAAMASGRLESEYRIVRPDGSVRWVVDQGIPMFDAAGRLTRLIGVNVDVTERREYEQRLRELQLELLHASRLSAMGQMAAALAHELNQPLGAATNFLSAAQLALKADKPEATPRALIRIGKAIEQTIRAGAIVGRLRNYVARGETEKHIASARQLVEDAVALALVGAKDPNLRVRFDFEKNEPEILVDRIQFQQVIFNLIRNALEATEGKTQREIIVATRAAANEEIEVSVADTGPGLPRDPEFIFQPFATTKAKGMGIGLSICRTIAEAHGGRLWAEQRQGGGAVFQFTLPTARLEEAVNG